MMTQDEVNLAFTEAKIEWEKMISDSGESKSQFIVSGKATGFLYRFEQIREVILSAGLDMPKLDDSVTLRIVEND